MYQKQAKTLLHKYLLSIGFTHSNDAVTTNSSYYKYKDFKLRVSDHFSAHEDDLIYILIPINKINQFGVFFKRAYLGFNGLRALKNFIFDLLLLSEIDYNQQVHLKRKEIVILDNMIKEKEVESTKQDPLIQELNEKISKQRCAYSALNVKYASIKKELDTLKAKYENV